MLIGDEMETVLALCSCLRVLATRIAEQLAEIFVIIFCAPLEHQCQAEPCCPNRQMIDLHKGVAKASAATRLCNGKDWALARPSKGLWKRRRAVDLARVAAMRHGIFGDHRGDGPSGIASRTLRARARGVEAFFATIVERARVSRTYVLRLMCETA